MCGDTVQLLKQDESRLNLKYQRPCPAGNATELELAVYMRTSSQMVAAWWLGSKL